MERKRTRPAPTDLDSNTLSNSGKKSAVNTKPVLGLQPASHPKPKPPSKNPKIHLNHSTTNLTSNQRPKSDHKKEKPDIDHSTNKKPQNNKGTKPNQSPKLSRGPQHKKDLKSSTPKRKPGSVLESDIGKDISPDPDADPDLILLSTKKSIYNSGSIAPVTEPNRQILVDAEYNQGRSLIGPNHNLDHVTAPPYPKPDPKAKRGSDKVPKEKPPHRPRTDGSDGHNPEIPARFKPRPVVKLNPHDTGMSSDKVKRIGPTAIPVRIDVESSQGNMEVSTGKMRICTQSPETSTSHYAQGVTVSDFKSKATTQSTTSPRLNYIPEDNVPLIASTEPNATASSDTTEQPDVSANSSIENVIPPLSPGQTNPRPGTIPTPSPGDTNPGSKTTPRPGDTNPGSKTTPRPGDTNPVSKTTPRPGDTNPGSKTTPRPGGTNPGSKTTPRPGGTDPGSKTTPSPGETNPGSKTTPKPGDTNPGSKTTPRPGGTNPGSKTNPKPGDTNPGSKTTPRPGGTNPGSKTTPRPGGTNPGSKTTPRPGDTNPGSKTTPRPGGTNPGSKTTPRPGDTNPGSKTTPRPGGTNPGSKTTPRPGDTNPGSKTTPRPGGTNPGSKTTPRPGDTNPGSKTTPRPGATNPGSKTTPNPGHSNSWPWTSPTIITKLGHNIPGRITTLSPGYNNPGDSYKGDSNPGQSIQETINPGYTNPGHSNPGHSNAADNTPGHINPGHTKPGHTNTGHSNPGRSNPGEDNPGQSNPGDDNPGQSNQGNSNPGDDNPVQSNPGHTNLGESSNPGHTNPGRRDPGHTNTGGINPGHTNTGGINPGHTNTGDSNRVTIGGGINPGLHNPDLRNPDLRNPDLRNPDLRNPDLRNPDLRNPDLRSPDLRNPELRNPELRSPELRNPELRSSELRNPELRSPDTPHPLPRPALPPSPGRTNPGLTLTPIPSTTPSTREMRVKINQVVAFPDASLHVKPQNELMEKTPPKVSLKQGGKKPHSTDGRHPMFPSSKLPRAPRDCSEHLNRGDQTTGLHLVTPDPRLSTFPVFCDMEHQGGGWTVIQRRRDGSVSFNRTWVEYSEGFGEMNGGEFWLGNEKIHLLTRARDMVLRVELEDFEGLREHAEYGKFRVASERQRYRLTVGGYSGSAGDALRFSRNYDHNNKAFTTLDRDNDRYPSGNCGAYYSSGWWFDACMAANLNGRYYVGKYKGVRDGIFWGTWHNISTEYYLTNDRQSFKTVTMMIRPKGHEL
ncbi:mucin-2-like [Gadus chalcogrammus]|uniref:mucin-2-like n=1 Tax=Gadus chalcogrammus TaxID=1042646 RepID=UPI0024C4AC23|nr:mucin-2-like [Gadus chalcogrammus]XP_056455525.1 mucin-2-like [Gadus chalcogrammus]